MIPRCAALFSFQYPITRWNPEFVHTLGLDDIQQWECSDDDRYSEGDDELFCGIPDMQNVINTKNWVVSMSVFCDEKRSKALSC